MKAQGKRDCTIRMCLNVCFGALWSSILKRAVSADRLFPPDFNSPVHRKCVAREAKERTPGRQTRPNILDLMQKTGSLSRLPHIVLRERRTVHLIPFSCYLLHACHIRNEEKRRKFWTGISFTALIYRHTRIFPKKESRMKLNFCFQRVERAKSWPFQILRSSAFGRFHVLCPALIRMTSIIACQFCVYLVLPF